MTVVKCDNTPADDGDIFEFSELISGFSLLWGVTPYANSWANFDRRKG